MSTFHGLIEELEGISLDRFNESNVNSTIFFLSHYHSDHTFGLEELLSTVIEHKEDVYLYASPVTIRILKNFYPKSTRLKELEIGIAHELTFPKTKETFTVTLFPAGHCPGSVMFLLETSGKRVLYTGDIRVRVNEFKKFKALYDSTGDLKRIDKIYLDTTFFRKEYAEFPSRRESLDEFFNLISPWIENKKNLVKFELPANFGSEYLYIELSTHFKMPIHVSKKRYDVYKHIPEMDGCVTTDETSTQIHSSCSKWNKCNYFCDTIFHSHPKKVLEVKPTCLRFKNHDYNNGIIEKVNENRYIVCYSSHCSYNELLDILRFLKPKDIYPNVEHDSVWDTINSVMKEINETHQIEEQTLEKTDWLIENAKLSSDEDDVDPFAFMDEPDAKKQKR